MNEMTELDRFRSDVPELDLTDVRAEERLLMNAIQETSPDRERATVQRTSGHRRRARRGWVGLAAGLTAAATAGVIAVNAGGEPGAPQVVHTMPVASVQVLKRAADSAAKSPELHPRPGQFLVFASRTTDTVESNSGGRHERYLDRQERKIWLPVDGDATHGVLWAKKLKPKPYPGWPVPSQARQDVGNSSLSKAADFDDRAEHLRNDYAYLSRLPVDPAKMYEHLYIGLGTGPEADATAWQNVGGMLTEAYMPRAQRAALFRAAAAIHGVTTVGRAVDAAGRTGVAVTLATAGSGVREEYIFDEKTYEFLGHRSVVTKAREAQAPVGSVLTNSAQLKISIADQPPAVS
ncbi:CU044_5270 family protein [Actinomadura citrea]|uniref:CU044_5270 family protein n=1 Tax=Actinomadura citrea TaxID=46158 RepID=UPI002E299DC6|nr:CU044_5270 family protein [Actinomadura citrea]